MGVESTKFVDWVSVTNTIPADAETRFFRFKMAE